MEILNEMDKRELKNGGEHVTIGTVREVNIDRLWAGHVPRGKHGIRVLGRRHTRCLHVVM